MTASFPTTVKTFTLKQDAVDDVQAAHINDIQDEVHAIEDFLWRDLGRAETAAAQVIATATWTIVDFGTVTADPLSQITTGAAWKFTAISAGYYLVNCILTFAASTAWAVGEICATAVYINGAIHCILSMAENNEATSHKVSGVGSDVVYLAAGSYLDIRVYQATGGDLALHNHAKYNYVSVAKVG